MASESVVKVPTQVGRCFGVARKTAPNRDGFSLDVGPPSVEGELESEEIILAHSCP